MKKIHRIPSLDDFLNEDIAIPAALQNQYLNVKKQISDKQTRKDQIMKQVNQLDNEINILNKNIIAIETQAAKVQGEAARQETEKANPTTTQQSTAKTNEQPQIQGQAIVKEAVEDIDAWWATYMTESITEDDGNDDEFEEDPDFEDEDEEEDENINSDEDSLEGDYVFALRVVDNNEEEDIIAKFYKDEDDDFWKARVVQGSEEPIESMQFDPDMDKVDIIDHLANMFDEVEEIDVDEYEDLLDDKEKVDDVFYDDIIKEE